MDALLGWRDRSLIQTGTRGENQRSITQFVARPSGRPFAAHGRCESRSRIYRRSDGEPFQPRSAASEPLPAMPYALVATDGRLFAGLADGQFWESRDQG